MFVDKQSASEGLEASSSVSSGTISEAICTAERVNIPISSLFFILLLMLSEHINKCRVCPSQSLKLADLDFSENAEEVSSSSSLWVLNKSIFTSQA